MSVGSITSINNMSNVQITRARSTDVKSKNIQNKIKEAQQQMQKVSAKEDLSVDEKANERKTQQKEISDLNTELKQHQEELLRSQRRDMMLAELQKDEKPTDTIGKESISQKEIKTTGREQDSKSSQEEKSVAASAGMTAQQAQIQGTVLVKNSDGTVILKGEEKANENRSVDADQKQVDEIEKSGIANKDTKSVNDDTDIDAGLSYKETHEMISADVSEKQTEVRGTVIARLREGIVVLKGEINQDEIRGVNTDQKQKELEKLEEKEEQARTFPPSALREESRVAKPLENAKVSGIESKVDNRAVINFSRLSKEDDQEAAQQRFYVSFGN